MSALGHRTADQISQLLDEYGIKHGPVVDSTRGLYEKKLREAMAKETKAKLSPDRTYYREEEEDITYVYRTPVRNESQNDSVYRRSRPEWSEREYDHRTSYSNYSRSRADYRESSAADEPQMYDSPSTYKSSFLQSTPLKSAQEAPKEEKSSNLVPLWVQLLVFLVLAVFLYFVFSNMETNEPFKGIESQ